MKVLLAALTGVVALVLSPSALAEVRFSTFNASLNRSFEGQLITDL